MATDPAVLQAWHAAHAAVDVHLETCAACDDLRNPPCPEGARLLEIVGEANRRRNEQLGERGA